MEKANPTKKAKAKPIAAKKGSEPTAKRYKKVVIPAYGAAAATEKYVTDESESEYERPAPKAKKAKKAPRPPLLKQDTATMTMTMAMAMKTAAMAA